MATANITMMRKAMPLQRVHFEMSRVREYFDLEELQTMTGQSKYQFAAVVLKELIDNSLDACESAGIAPAIRIRLDHKEYATRILVADNASGIPPEVVLQILNFETRTSDKAAYRAPTRGQLGNATKTILGMPFAFGINEPVTIEACGIRHVIHAGLDPAGELRVHHVQEAAAKVEPGTTIALTLPKDVCDKADASRWAQEFALFNPHASVQFEEIGSGRMHANFSEHHPQKSSKLYQSTVSFLDDWRKFLPTDATSPHWYDQGALARLVFAHMAHTRRVGGQDKLLRDFVREFRGLKPNSHAQAVCDQFPKIKRLSDFDKSDNLIDDLLEGMKEVVGSPPKPSVLGCVGKNHFERCFADWGGGISQDRFWYKKVEETHHGLPYVIEVAVAETNRSCGDPFIGVNFSPSFGDPLMGTSIDCEKFAARGFRGFLEMAHAVPSRGDDDGDDENGNGTFDKDVTTAAALHFVCPHLSIQDKGKTKIELPHTIVKRIGDALWHVTKTLYKEGERRKRDAAREERSAKERHHQNSNSMPLKQAVEKVMAEAVNQATGNGALPVSAHTLFYHVRPLVQKYNDHRQLKSNYFEQVLLPAYQRKHGVIPRLYYEPRGTLYEPHTGKAIPLGTREVSDYRFPSWLYDKILYVEKKGLWPVLEHARLAEKYDMAIVAGEGFACEACRVLFASAEQGHNYQLFVLHDADPYGYNIARTLRDETVRMPDHNIEVIDIGLRLSDALDMGVEPETFSRKKDLPQGLSLTDLERKHFVGRKSGNNWIAERIELNALSSPVLIAYTEAQLKAAGVRGKVVPDDASLPKLSRELYESEAKHQVATILDEILNRENLLQDITVRLAADVKLDGARDWINDGLQEDDYCAWRAVLKERFRDMLAKQPGLRDTVRQRVVDLLRPDTN